MYRWLGSSSSYSVAVSKCYRFTQPARQSIGYEMTGCLLGAGFL